jgi:hypothetical protein
MRNTVLFAAITLMYALGSHMDYLDEEMLAAHAADIRAEIDCRSLPADCPMPDDERLLLSRR